MIEVILNAVWLAVATGVFFLAPRCTPRKRVALIIALALLFPIISVSDDFNASAFSFSDAAAVAITILIANLLVAIARVHSVSERVYAVALAIPSDPRSPPR